MLPLRSRRSSTLRMSNCAYFASRTPSATFSKSQNTAMFLVSAGAVIDGLCDQSKLPGRGPVHPVALLELHLLRGLQQLRADDVDLVDKEIPAAGIRPDEAEALRCV